MEPRTEPKTSSSQTSRLGAFLLSNNRTLVRVWAPKAKQVDVIHVVMESGVETSVGQYRLSKSEGGIFESTLELGRDSLYRIQVDGKSARPDPRSRFQPYGVHGPSQVIASDESLWTDEAWLGVSKKDLVIYEMHLGSFTQEGTYRSAIEKLAQLRDFGITAIELLPLTQCPGRWNWGYDGVNYFAPSCNYGTPEDLKGFVNACHENGLAVINDVVYNHVGPEGNYLSEFGPYKAKQGTPWGDAFDFSNGEVRQFVIENVLFWIEEYHFDGLRLDAVHYMFDDSEFNILDEIQQRFLEYSRQIDRTIHLIGESNIYDPDLVGNLVEGNPHYDGIWSDCLMHSIYKFGCPEVRLTNRHYRREDIATALEHAYVFSTPHAIRVTDDLRREHRKTGGRAYINSLVMALQTHDSVGNHPHGKRLHQLTSVDFQKSAAALILLYPSIPMIFMGEEWATDSPFPFFADFEDVGLRKAVDKGRRDEYPHHDWIDSPLPSDPRAFLDSKSTPKMENNDVNLWYRSLLKLRRQGLDEGWLDVSHLETCSDLEHGIFEINYCTDELTVRICCRLDRDSSEWIPFESRGCTTTLLNSRTNSKALEPEHCIIWIDR
ncbi:MAG: alpha-amylase family glycosyl hydrolase [Planctomycetota bacterium]